MGQAKRRGTFEQRKAQALAYQIEAEAWEEYYQREYLRYQTWLFSKLSKEQQLAYLIEEKRKEMSVRELMAFFAYGLGVGGLR